MKTLSILLVFLMTSGGSCESTPPFEYENNTRLIIEGTLLNQNGSILSNYPVTLTSFDSNETVIVKKVYTNIEGRFFLSTPRGNNFMYINFNNTQIISTTHHTNLVHYNWIGISEEETYFDFGTITINL